MTASFDDPAEPTRGDLLAQLAALQGRLASLAAIEQAKGALMATYGLTADAAFDLLRFHSQTGNVKLRAIAAQLTSQLSTSPTNSLAITRFDRLIDQVTESLQTVTGATGSAPASSGAPVTMAALLAQITADRDPPVAPQVVPPPGVTIAGNVPGLPLIYANDAFTELTGYPIGDVLGRNCRFLQGAGTNPKTVATLGRALHTGRDITVVMSNYRSDGSVFLNEVSISPIRNPIHQITHFIGTQIDVTRRGEPTVCYPENTGRETAFTPQYEGHRRPGTAA